MSDIATASVDDRLRDGSRCSARPRIAWPPGGSWSDRAKNRTFPKGNQAACRRTIFAAPDWGPMPRMASLNCSWKGSLADLSSARRRWTTTAQSALVPVVLVTAAILAVSVVTNAIAQSTIQPNIGPANPGPVFRVGCIIKPYAGSAARLGLVAWKELFLTSGGPRPIPTGTKVSWTIDASGPIPSTGAYVFAAPLAPRSQIKIKNLPADLPARATCTAVPLL
jgi:hypothetical protein